MRIQYVKTSLTADWSDIPDVYPGAEFYHLEFSADKDGDVGFYFIGGTPPGVPVLENFPVRNRWVAKFAHPYWLMGGAPAPYGHTELPDGTIIINPEGYGSQMVVGADEEGNGGATVHKVVYLYHVGEIPNVPNLDS
ncbi:hypothetical protein [Nocardia sp. NPDC049707]|uniref:hypothetical protein n=1 Tax=Nocardia sp. NPDC049707 TaxID=3154735 RepID=UPI00344426D2